MRRLLLRCLLLAAFVAALLSAPAQANDARIASEKRIAARVVELTISTPAFTGSTKVDVDLPVGYDARRILISSTRLPRGRRRPRAA